jgi:hypothetical protein
VDEVLNGGRLELVDELFDPEQGRSRSGGSSPCAPPPGRSHGGRRVSGRRRQGRRPPSLGNSPGEWRGHPPTGQRFERIDEVYFFTVRDTKITEAWGIEYTAARARQLGLAAGQSS